MPFNTKLHLGHVVGAAWLVCWLAAPPSASAAVITRDSEKLSRAERLFQKAQNYVLEGEPATALERFQSVVRVYGTTPYAPLAQWEAVRLHEFFGDYVNAFDALQLLIDHFPGHYEKALRRQFEIALTCLNRYDALMRTDGVRAPKDLPEKEQVSSMLRIVVENGPYADFVAEANYYLAVALEKEGDAPQSAKHHEEFLDRFPWHPLADDSGYQVAYILYKYWMKMKGGAPTNRDRAALAMKWFLARYPESDKASQARNCLAEITNSERNELASLARYYEVQGDERAAAVYYRELASKFPEVAPEGSPLRERIAAWMEKFPELHREEPPLAATAPMLEELLDPLYITPAEMGSEAFEFADEASPPPGLEPLRR